VVAAEPAVVLHHQARLLEDLSAECRPLVDERDLQPERPRLDGGGEPSGPAADDEDVVGISVS
jgi:hypothetical protein